MGFFLLGCKRKQSQGKVLQADQRGAETAAARDQPLAPDDARHRSGDGPTRRCVMSWLRFFRRNRADAALQEEIDVYLAEETAENIARGVNPEEALRRARIKLGNPRSV